MMKLQTAIGLCVVVFGLSGCAHSPSYDPSLKPVASADLVKVVSLKVEPAKPIAPEPWRVTMKIKNTSGQALENVTYTFVIGGTGESLGEGKIARLDPGATVSVKSDVAKVENGTYRVEGRVFLQNAKGEPEFSDRMNNWMATNVVVAQ
jgi:hypothetical protein